MKKLPQNVPEQEEEECRIEKQKEELLRLNLQDSERIDEFLCGNDESIADVNIPEPTNEDKEIHDNNNDNDCTDKDV